jgi:hypothetical protein
MPSSAQMVKYPECGTAVVVPDATVSLAKPLARCCSLRLLAGRAKRSDSRRQQSAIGGMRARLASPNDKKITMKTRTRLLDERSFGTRVICTSRPRRRPRSQVMLEQLETRLTPGLIRLASFNDVNGAEPNALIMDSSGNLYGTTY